ncbi:TLD-domain-containing protein [Absidia repens]|uniref:TLD-domain-containing protein n=1 Tax=Absidia repens TaxID=90262 RepID=A0A1X2I317_9FUNG|nr:TLD-domain-containing protein [Absidia repens]
MGQSHSTSTAKTQSNASADTSQCDVPSLKRKKSIQQVKQKLTRSELLALHQTFQQLKSVSPDHVDFIEPKRFLEHLHLPSTLEPAGVLLFKSFSRLGAYPNCNLSSAPIHLSWNSFLTAFAVLTGKLDDPQHDTTVFETTFFDSLAIPLRASTTTTTTTSTTTTTGEDEQHNTRDTVDTFPNQLDDTSSHKGYTLADLGIRFDDEDEITSPVNSGDITPAATSQDTLKMLKTDLKELFILAIWIVHAEHAEQQNSKPDIDAIRHLADTLTNTIYVMDEHSTTKDSNDDDDCISHYAFCLWKSRNAPYLFKTIQSFIYTRFAMAVPKKSLATTGDEDEGDDDGDTTGDDTSSLRTIDLVLSQDIAPLPVDTDILNTNCCALLSWCLPPMYLTTKHWTRLYSGTKDGFSMNRFENHVFKYPGPTLLVMQIQVTHNNNNNSSSSSSSGKHHHTDDIGKMMMLVSVVNEPWKQGRNYWGTDQCFLAELSPRFELFKPTGRNQHYVYYHSHVGLAFGGTTSHQPPTPQPQQTHPSTGEMTADACMLFLDNTLQTGRYHQEMYPALPTFEKSQQHRSACSSSSSSNSSNSSFDYGFDIVNLEVFGLGNEKLTLAQKKAWDFEYQDANRRAGVQIRQQDGQIDKEILRLAGIIQGDQHYYDSNQPPQRRQDEQ